MMRKPVATIILAAGKGKRMKSNLPKVMHTLNEKPLVDWVVETALESGSERVIAVVGHGRELVMNHLSGRVEFTIQIEQLGTGHAVLMTESILSDFDGDVLILSGDVPLLKVKTVLELIDSHRRENNFCTMITCIFENPFGYGRIVRGESGEVIGIVEERDADSEQKKIREINSGIYLVNAVEMFKSLKLLKTDNAQGEYYLTDIVSDFVNHGLRVGGHIVKDPLEISGVNSIEQLRELEKKFLERN